MYFSKRRKALLKKAIISGCYKVFDVRLSVGEFGADGLESIVDTMFAAWRKVTASRSRGYLRNFDGILRRFFLSYDAVRGLYKPYFHLLCVRRERQASETERYKIQLEEERLRLLAYIKWLSSWVSVMKLCTSVGVDFSVVELDALDAVLADFCSNEKYAARALLDEMRQTLCKRVCERHRLVSFHGIFRDAELNRHVSVER